jgi:bifunctional non-homologous end joining protein LigD
VLDGGFPRAFDNKIMTIESAVEGTHLEKVYWPKGRYTKRDMLEYYDRVAPYILPHLKDRPVVLKRFPRGIKDQSFFQKNVKGTVPRFVKRVVIRAQTVAKDVHYIVCNNVETLLYLANLGTIELHPWGSRLTTLYYPDYMIFDLDPGSRTTNEMVVNVAQKTRRLLDELGLPSYPKTSGKRGIHVYVPLQVKFSYDFVRNFARRFAKVLMVRYPKLVTAERGEKHRVGKIYVDYLRNAVGQTAVASYSLRDSEDATVSTPLEWKEVREDLRPESFTIMTIASRVAKKGDLFEGVLKQHASLKGPADKLQTVLQFHGMGDVRRRGE